MQEKADHTFDANATKPEPYVALVLYFADGTRRGGIWTGKVWWSEGCAVYPVRWQRMQGPEPQDRKKEKDERPRKSGPSSPERR